MKHRKTFAGVMICAVAVLGCWLVPAYASAAPALVGSVSSSTDLSGALSVAVSGHYAYTTAYYAGELTAVDISNPAQPAIAGHSAANPNLRNSVTVNVSGGYAFVVSKNRNLSTTNNTDGTGNSLTILDIHTNPAVPAIVGTVRNDTTLFGAYGVAVQGTHAYVAAQGCLFSQPCPDPSVGNAFDVIDISNLGHPSIVATLQSPASPFGSALAHADSVVVGNYAYVTASNSNSLTIVNISNPSAPTIAGSVSSATDLNIADDVAVQGNFAYVAAEGTPGHLTVVDVSNPASPRIVSSLADPALNGAYRVRLRGSVAAVSGSSSDTVSAVDISDPLHPRLVGSVADPAHLHRTTGLDFDSSGRYVIAASPYLSSQSRVDFPPFPFQAGGPTETGTVSVIDLTPGIPTPVPTPVISGLHQAARVWQEHRPKHGKPKHHVGTTFRFNLNEAARVTLSFTQTRPGRKVHGRCVAPTKKNRRNRSCRRTVVVKSLIIQGHTGANTFRFSGKVRGSFLRAGGYTLVLKATAGGKSTSKSITFTIAAS